MIADEELMVRAQAGDKSAFSDLIRRYEGPLYGYLVRILKNEQAAQDAFQDTWMRILKALDRFDPNLRFSPWLYRIATNLTRDYMRRRRLRAHPSLDQPINNEAGTGVLGDLIAAPGFTPEERASSSEIGTHVREAVEQLPEKQREAFVLRHYQGLTYEEIARAQKCSLSAVKSNIHHAVVSLRRRLERLKLSPVAQT